MKSGPKTPLRKHSLADTLAQRLQRRIAAGKFRTGERLPTESELMRMFGVRPLDGARSGADAIRPGIPERAAGRRDIRRSPRSVRCPRGAAVASRPISANWTKYGKFWKRPLSNALLHARTPQDMERIESLLAQRGAAAEAGDLERCIAADIAFHAAIAEATHNEILSELYRTTTGHLQKGFRHIYRDTACFRASQPTHARLARNIADTDVQQALDTIAVILDEP